MILKVERAVSIVHNIGHGKFESKGYALIIFHARNTWIINAKPGSMSEPTESRKTMVF